MKMQLPSNFYWLFVFVNVSIFLSSQSEPTCFKGKRAKKLNNKFVKEYNEFRRRRGVPLLKLDPKLIKEATDWSYHQAKKGTMEHSKLRKGVGENLAKWYTIQDEELPPIQAWYNETDKYKGGDFSIETGNVDDATGKLGCGVCADSQVKNLYITCRYFPSGNHSTQFEETVFRPKSKHTTTRKATKGKERHPSATDDDNVSTPNLAKTDSNVMKSLLFAITIFLLILSSLPTIALFSIFYNYLRN